MPLPRCAALQACVNDLIDLLKVKEAALWWRAILARSPWFIVPALVAAGVSWGGCEAGAHDKAHQLLLPDADSILLLPHALAGLQVLWPRRHAGAVAGSSHRQPLLLFGLAAATQHVTARLMVMAAARGMPARAGATTGAAQAWRQRRCSCQAAPADRCRACYAYRVIIADPDADSSDILHPDTKGWQVIKFATAPSINSAQDYSIHFGELLHTCASGRQHIRRCGPCALTSAVLLAGQVLGVGSFGRVYKGEMR